MRTLAAAVVLIYLTVSCAAVPPDQPQPSCTRATLYAKTFGEGMVWPVSPPHREHTVLDYLFLPVWWFVFPFFYVAITPVFLTMWASDESAWHQAWLEECPPDEDLVSEEPDAGSEAIEP